MGTPMKEYDKDQELEEIMHAYGDELVRLAYTYVKDADTAKEVVQNVFVTVYSKLHTFRKESSLKTWLYRITINKSKDYLKSWYVKNKESLASSHFEALQLSPSAESIVMNEQHALQVRQALFRLPKKYRTPVYLYYYEDFSVIEIAEILRTSTNTIKTRLRRGREKLKDLLQGVI
ncbi:sigma-70 family RNA polymerase sigma factor [Bacillus gobiensis]